MSRTVLVSTAKAQEGYTIRVYIPRRCGKLEGIVHAVLVDPRNEVILLQLMFFLGNGTSNSARLPA